MTLAAQPAGPPVTGISALVSGATGFLGGRLSVLLREKGYSVRALVRSAGVVDDLVRSGVEIVRGDVGDRASLVRAMAGRQWVFHTAGKVSDWGPRRDFQRINVDGTARVIDACREAGVRRLVHVSSLTVLGLPRSGKRMDENSPVAESPRDYYTESKLAGERLVRDAHGRDGLETVVIRPGVIWGPGDATIWPRLEALLRRRRLVLIGRGTNHIALSHVDNLSRGLILAAQSAAAAGRIYHLTDGEDLTARFALTALAKACGVPPPRFSLPFPVVYSLAAMMEGATRWRRAQNPPALTRYGVRLVACDGRFDIEKARNELGYNPEMTFRRGVAAMVRQAGKA